METKLDIVLDIVREPHPSDDLFVGRVMADIRADSIRRARRRRFFARPAAAAAAVAIVVGGAAAAIVRSNAPAPDVALPATQEGDAADEPVPNAPPVSAPAKRSEAKSGTEPGGFGVYRDGDREWGYESETKAYAVDNETGLRLETEVYRNEFDTDVPHRVTLTLRNTGERPVAITAPKGCELVVAAYPEEGRDDGDDTYAWQCASSGEAPGASRDAERFVMGAGEKRVAEATVVLGTSGDWRVVGMCQCSFEGADRAEPSDPAPLDGPLKDIGELGAELPALPEAPRSSEQSKGLITPPIRVKAS